MLFADLLSLHLVTFLMLCILVDNREITWTRSAISAIHEHVVRICLLLETAAARFRERGMQMW